MRRTSSMSVSVVQVSGWSYMAVRTSSVPTPPPFLTMVWITSRKVSMPTRSPCSITTSEPMSFSAMASTARARGSSGWTVKRVLPLTRRMSLTFMVLLRGRRWGAMHLGVKYSPQSQDYSRSIHLGDNFMPGYADPGFDTLALHAGATPDPATGARAVPIHLTTSFVFESSDHAAALLLAICTLMGAGSHIVASTALYGGSQNLLHYTLRRFGIETTFVKPGDIDGWKAAVRPNTRLLFGETVGNPGLDV